MKEHTKRATKRLFVGTLAVSALTAAFEAQAYETVGACELCTGVDDSPVQGTNIGECGPQPGQIGVIGGPGGDTPQFFYRLDDQNVRCFRESSNGDLIPCEDLRLCCLQGFQGWFGCSRSFNNNCEPVNICSNQCCMFGAMMKAVSVPDCPGATAFFLECEDS